MGLQIFESLEFQIHGRGGVQSHFHVKPKLRLGQVELRLGWGFDNFWEQTFFFRPKSYQGPIFFGFLPFATLRP